MRLAVKVTQERGTGMAGTHRVVCLFRDSDGAARLTSKPKSKAKAEELAKGIRANGFPGRGKPDSVRVVAVACDAVTAIMMGAMR